jgi:hypothetical protein
MQGRCGDGCKWRSGEHVDYGLRSWAEIEGEAAVVGGCVAGYRRVGFGGAEGRCLCVTGRKWWQPALSGCVAAVIAHSPTVTRRVL